MLPEGIMDHCCLLVCYYIYDKDIMSKKEPRFRIIILRDT